MTRGVWARAVVTAAVVSMVKGFIVPVLPMGRTTSPLCVAHSCTGEGRVPYSGLRGAMLMHTVTMEHDGQTHIFEADEGTTVLEAALENGVELPHDCKLGVCLTCPSKVVSGKITQPDGTLDDSVVAQGFALTCCTYVQSDVTIRSVAEDEMVGAQFSDRN